MIVKLKERTLKSGFVETIYMKQLLTVNTYWCFFLPSLSLRRFLKTVKVKKLI